MGICNWIVANYQAIIKINAAIPALRLIAEERDKKTGEIFFKLQIAGKNIFPIVSLQDLFEELLNCIDLCDVSSIKQLEKR